MRLYNLKTGTKPLVIHAQGFSASKLRANFSNSYRRLNPLWPFFYEAWKKSPVFAESEEKTGDITVITCNSNKEPGILEESLKGRFPLKVAGRGINPWKNVFKIKLFSELLDAVETPFVMGVDCFDAVAIGSLGEAVSRFGKMNCRMLFNGTWEFFPNCGYAQEGGCPYITEKWKSFEKRYSGGSYWPYLNAGAWIGETAFARRFFQDAAGRNVLSLVENGQLPAGKKNSWQNIEEGEQIIMHWMFFDHYPEVKVDTGCEIFQTLGFVPVRGYLKIRPLPFKCRLEFFFIGCKLIFRKILDVTRPLRGYLGLRKSNWVI